MNRFLLPVLLVFFQFFNVFGAEAASRFVATTGNDAANDCLTAATPCATIQYATTQAVSGDSIEVAAGTYNELVTPGSKTLTFLGAQHGVDARTRAVPPAQESIVDGTSLGNILLIVGGANSIVDGFTFQNAPNASIQTSSTASGYQIINNIFQDNFIGLSPACDGASPTLVQHNLFRNNAPFGGIYNDSIARNITVDENSFVDNPANAINFTFTPPDTNSDVTITNNEITNSGSLILLGVDNGTISGNSVTDFAPFDFDAPLIIGGAVQNLTISENVWKNGPEIGIHIIDLLATPNQNVTIHQNNISQFPGGCLVVDSGAHTGTVDATNNYWDCVGGPGVPDCTGDATCEPALLAPFPKSIALTLSSASVSVGGTDQIVVTGTLADGTTADVAAECSFTSSDPSVAEVDSTGLVTAIGSGTATVTTSCFDGQFTDTADIQVAGGGGGITPDIGGSGCALIKNAASPSAAGGVLLTSMLAALAWIIRRNHKDRRG